MHILILLVAFVIGSDQPHPTASNEDGYKAGEVRGTVVVPAASNRSQNRFRGRAYRNRTSQQSPEESAAISNPLLDVVISAHPISYDIEPEPLPEPVRIIQQDAVFIPTVTPVTVGSIVQFVNNDPFFHNVFSLTPGARFNIGRRPKGDVYSKEIPQLSWKVEGIGPINLYCDIHSQMSAVILSLDTPYFTKLNEDGSFSLANLPDGDYEIRAYHPRFELITKRVTVRDGEIVELDMIFS